MSTPSENDVAFKSPSGDVKFICHTRQDLMDVALNIQRGLHRGVVPITIARATCMLANPDIETNDTLLITCVNNNGETIGYAGVMPGHAFINGSKVKVGWISTGYVSFRYRPLRIGEQLVMTAARHYPLTIANGANQLAQAMYRRLTFKERAGPRAAVIRLGRWRPCLTRSKCHISSPDNVDNRISPDLLSLLAKFHLDKAPAVFSRREDNIRWMFEHSWFSRTQQPNAHEKSYHFLVQNKSVSHHAIDIRDRAGNIHSGAIYSVIHNKKVSLKILDTWSRDEKSWRKLLRKLLARAVAIKANQIIIQEDKLPATLGGLLLRLSVRYENSPYFFHSEDPKLVQAFNDFILSPTDGDLPHW